MEWAGLCDSEPRQKLKYLAGALLAGAVALATPFEGHTGQTSEPDLSVAGFAAHEAMARASPFRKLAWSFLGPTNIGGGAFDVAVADRGTSRRLYVVYHAGLWMTDDDGHSWQAIDTRS